LKGATLLLLIIGCAAIFLLTNALEEQESKQKQATAKASFMMVVPLIKTCPALSCLLAR
jgi:hypothetical protein